MTPAPIPVTPASPLVHLTAAQFQTLADISPELEWFANRTNANTQRAHPQDMQDFMVFAGLRQPEQVRDVTRACHSLAGPAGAPRSANGSIRGKLAALSSLYAYLGSSREHSSDVWVCFVFPVAPAFRSRE